MAKIECTNCGMPVSEKAKRCKKCGTTFIKEKDILAIDKEYLNKVRQQKRGRQIDQINELFIKMTDEQFDNVYDYIRDEYYDPNYETKLWR